MIVFPSPPATLLSRFLFREPVLIASYSQDYQRCRCSLSNRSTSGKCAVVETDGGNVCYGACGSVKCRKRREATGMRDFLSTFVLFVEAQGCSSIVNVALSLLRKAFFCWWSSLLLPGIWPVRTLQLARIIPKNMVLIILANRQHVWEEVFVFPFFFLCCFFFWVRQSPSRRCC